MVAKFHGNILNLSENIAQSFRVLLFLTHTVEVGATKLVIQLKNLPYTERLKELDLKFII